MSQTTEHGSLTIVIPTYNRPRHLRRLLILFRELDNKYPILILDGSAADAQEKNRALTKEFPEITLRQFPTEYHFGHRVADGIRGVKTEFVAFCGDDDFILPDSVTQCLDYMKAHPDYSAAIGRVVGMGYSTRFLTRGIFIIDDIANGYHLKMDSFAERYLYWKANSQKGASPLFYAVRRTAHVLESFALTTDRMKISAVELMNETIILLRGRAVVLPVLYGFRDYTAEVFRFELRDDPIHRYTQADLDYFRPILAKKLRETEKLSEEVAGYIADIAIRNYTKDSRTDDREELRYSPSFVAAWDTVRTKPQRLLKALASAYCPEFAAKALDTDPKVMKAIRTAQAALLE